MDNKNKKIKAFSLVEIIVATSISMIIMLGLGVFVNSGLKTIFLQQKSIQNSLEINDFTKEIYETFDSISNSGQINITQTGIIFERKTIYDKGGYSFVGEEELDSFYCPSDSESPITKHIYIKNFIPFIEENDDFQNNFSGTLISSGVSLNSQTYYTKQKEHKVVDQNGKTIIGKHSFGYNYANGEIGTGVYLNSPTGIASDGEVIYISDSLNDRILYLSGGLVYTLLDENDGIKKPTGLYYEDNSLYISNSGKGEILKFESSDYLSENQNFSFSGVNEQNVTQVFFEFLNNGNSSSINITSIDLDMIVGSHNGGDDYKTVNTNNNIVDYSFQTPIFSGGLSTGEIIGKTSSGVNFYPDETSSFDITDIDGVENPGNYSINMKIGDTIKSFYYYTKSDSKVSTTSDNNLVITSSGLIFPNGIWGNANNEFNEFDISSIDYIDYEKNDYILSMPIESINISNDSDLLNIIIKYYHNYDCYNLDANKEKIKTVLWKYSLK